MVKNKRNAEGKAVKGQIISPNRSKTRYLDYLEGVNIELERFRSTTKQSKHSSW